VWAREHLVLEDEVSSVANSLSKLGDEIIVIRQNMTKLSSTLREEPAEVKHILSSMHTNKTFTSPIRKEHRQVHNSDSASASSNDEKMMFGNTSATAKDNDITPDMLKKTE
jgi:hypothetical protein